MTRAKPNAPQTVAAPETLATSDPLPLTCSKDMNAADIRVWEAHAVAMRADQFTRVREAAKLWAGTISAIAGTSAILTALQARDPIKSLQDGWFYPWGAYEYGVVLGLGLALIAIVVAIVAAYRAQASLSKKVGVYDICMYYNNGPFGAAKLLTISQIVTGVALILYLASLVALWYGPTATPGRAMFVAVPETGAAVCGALESDPTTGTVSLRPTATASPLPIANIVAFTAVERC